MGQSKPSSTQPKPDDAASAAGVSPRNTLNELTAKEWISETVSVWRQKGLGQGHPDTAIERQHPAPFSYTDVSRLIRFFTKSGQVVLDPFVGVGSTLKAAALEGRSSIGIEINPDFIELSRQRIEKELEPSLFEQPAVTLLEGDARSVLKKLPDSSVDFCVTSPPYWNILHKRDHKARQERESKGLATKYSDNPLDLGNIADYGTFLKELNLIFAEVYRILRPKKYLAVIVSDFRSGGELVMFHADLASSLQEIGFNLHGLSVLHQPHKRVYPYGYPTTYVPNIHHQYILILRNG
jgi:DNA modification methylase